MASTADLEAEILAELEENPDAYVTPVNDVITIDPETRTIRLPASEMLFGVEEEKDVERKFFKCPRIVGDNIDLFTHQIYVNYIFAENKNGTFPEEAISTPYWCDDVALDETGNYITFSWLLSGNVLAHPGFVAFAICAKYVDGEALKTRWKTTPAIGNVLMTVPDSGQSVAEMYPDIISQLLNRMDAVEAIATPEEIQNYVEAYLAENPPSGMTAEEKEQLDKNTEDISSLSEEIANLGGGGSGLSSDAKALLIAILRNAVYTSDQSTSITAFEKSLVSSGGSSGDSGSGETEVTLSGITATYSGGEVSEGTDVADLTGITVLAVYSNGSTKTVTGYTLTGEIAEGTNTITVSYGGMTTTFTVIGLAVFGYDDIAIGSTVNFNNSQMGISTSTGTINRATLIPIGQYLKKDKTYKISLGDASANYYYGVQIFVASVDGLVFEITGGQQSFDTVTTREIDTGWMQTDYEYTATDDNRIIAVNFKNSANGTLTESDREILLANVTVEEV